MQFQLFSKTRKQDTQKLNHKLLKEVTHNMRKLVIFFFFFTKINSNVNNNNGESS
jgi:hypothetical protein